MILTPNVVYKIDRTNNDVRPITIRNAAVANIYLGFSDINSNPQSLTDLDIQGPGQAPAMSGGVAIFAMDMLLTCDFIGVDGLGVSIYGANLTPIA